MSESSVFTLRLFGSPQLTGPDGKVVGGRAGHRHRIALLALLCRSPTGVSRDVLMATLWPESDLEQARNLLKVSVYVLRQALDDESIVTTGDSLRIGMSTLASDVVAFEEALAAGDLEEAVSLHRARFMEGFALKESSEFEHWMDRERGRLSDSYASALESLAEQAVERGDVTAATEWWKARAAHDPYDSRVALRLMEVLAAGGNHAAAVRHAGIHARLLSEDLGIEPPQALAAWVEKVRADPPETVLLPGQVMREPSLHPARQPDDRSNGLSAAGLASNGRRRWLRPAALAAAVAASLALLRLWAVGDPADAPPSPNAFEDLPEASGPARVATTNVRAWELYRRASQPEVLRSDSTARQALDMFRQAVELDPTFAGAHAGLALSYLRVAPAEAPQMSRFDRLSAAREHARVATELDSTNAEAYGALGLAEMNLHRFDEAEEHLQRAIALDATSDALQWIVTLYIWTGRYEEALVHAERALELDPLSPSALAEVGRALMVNGRCDETLARLQPLAGLDPPLLRAGAIVGQCHGEAENWDEAVAVVERSSPGGGSYAAAQLGNILAQAGRTEEASAILAGLLEESRRSSGSAYWVAMVYAGLGQVEEALEWLDRSILDHTLASDVREPFFASLHGDPRFQQMLERIGL
jgi:DNA-binding SARP family transcriptional activator